MGLCLVMRVKLVPISLWKDMCGQCQLDKVISESFGGMYGFFCLKHIINCALIASKWETLKGTRFWH